MCGGHTPNTTAMAHATLSHASVVSQRGRGGSDTGRFGRRASVLIDKEQAPLQDADGEPHNHPPVTDLHAEAATIT
jgi:hypothetical protein